MTQNPMRVVITGMGAISPLGGDVPSSMQRVVEYADEWMPHPDRFERSCLPTRGRMTSP